MADNVFKFRSLKWGDPKRKLKMLPGAARPSLGRGAMSPLKWLMSNIGILLAASAVGFAGVYAFNGDEPLVDAAMAMLSGECNIKGNISMNTGEKIYHVPGQEYYHATHIDTSKGERWFCSEAEARVGWLAEGEGLSLCPTRLD